MICIIYHIVCKITKKILYVGSTTNLNIRISQHKCCCNNINNNRHHLLIYSYIRDNGGFNNFDFVTCEIHDDITKEQRYEYEQNEINRHNGLLNCKYAKRSETEYRIDNKKKISEYHKDYYNNNKEKRKKQVKTYYENNKDKAKIYHENNKKKINERHKEYYKNNKDKIIEKVTCECGCVLTKHNLPRHKKSTKHNESIKNQLPT